MSYVQSVLQPGEEVRYQASIHWITYFHGALWLIAACIVWIIAPESWRGGFTVRVIEIVLVAVGVIFLARAWFEWWITEIAVTNRRVIYKRGLISPKTAEMHSDKSKAVKPPHSTLGRLLNCGRLTIKGTGAGVESFGAMGEPI